MLDGRYDPAFAPYFTQNGDDASADLPKGTGRVIFGILGLWVLGTAALSGAVALLTQ